MKIRDARGSDRDAIAAMWRELIAYHRAQDSRFLVAPDGERRYGRHMQEMMRSRDARVLVAQPAEREPICGYMVVELQTRPPMALPGRVWLRLGFVRAGIRRGGRAWGGFCLRRRSDGLRFARRSRLNSISPRRIRRRRRSGRQWALIRS